jgi:hypothetical protein
MSPLWITALIAFLAILLLLRLAGKSERSLAPGCLYL